MNVILGGGAVALFARDILGPDWHVVPIGQSLYYSYSPPLADNFIIRDDITDRYLSHMIAPEYVKNSFSLKGYLTQDAMILKEWLCKKYDGEDNVPSQADAYWKSHMGYFAHAGVANIYKSMQVKFWDELTTSNEDGMVSRIDLKNREIHLTNKVIEYEKLINTIPLYAFLKLANIESSLPSKNLWCYHVRSDEIDLEGSTNVFIVDQNIPFYQATKVGNYDYIFYSTSEVTNPGETFMIMLNKFELFNETMVPKGIACGRIPNLTSLDEGGVLNMGSGVWDDCLDLGSCVKRLLKMKN